MKILKYVAVLLAVVAMSASFASCDKEVDPKVDAKQNYWIDLTLSNPGSLSTAAQARFVELKDTTIYGEKNIKIMEHPLYCTQDYALQNFNTVIAVPNAESDIVQKIMLPTSQYDGSSKRDFEVTLTLSKDSMQTVIASKVFRAAEVLN